MLTGRTTLTFEDVLKALRDNERMTGNDSSSSSDKLLLADDSGRGRNFQHGSSKGCSKSRMGGDRDMSVVECYYCRDKCPYASKGGRCPQFREYMKSLRDSREKRKVERCVKTALNVKYVLGAARNILSLGVLTSRGFRYVGRKETCKVYKRDQLVIRGRKIPNNLCYLEGEALQGRIFCGGNKGKKKIEKRVHFSDKDEVLGILSQGRIY
ncbi:hypothetical protein Tco_1475771 [Tanacetum coccineum]